MNMSFLPWRRGPVVYRNGTEAGRANCAPGHPRLLAEFVVGRRQGGEPRAGEATPTQRPLGMIGDVGGGADAPPPAPSPRLSPPPVTPRCSCVARYGASSCSCPLRNAAASVGTTWCTASLTASRPRRSESCSSSRLWHRARACMHSRRSSRLWHRARACMHSRRGGLPSTAPGPNPCPACVA